MSGWTSPFPIITEGLRLPSGTKQLATKAERFQCYLWWFVRIAKTRRHSRERGDSKEGQTNRELFTAGKIPTHTPRPSADFWLKDNAFVPSSKMLSLLFHFFSSKRNRLLAYLGNERDCIKNLFIVIFFLAETACGVPPFGQHFDRKQ